MAAFQSRAIGVTERAKQLTGEWAIFFLRWVLLACIAGAILLDPTLHPLPSGFILFFAVVAIYNLAVALVIYLNLYFSAFPSLTLIADIAAVLTLIHLRAGLSVVFPILAIFPILIAALRFSWQAGLLTAILFVLDAIIRIAITQGPGLSPLLGALPWLAVLYLLTAAVAGVVSEWVPRAPVLSWTRRRDVSVVPEQLRMVYDLASSLSATLNYERVLEAILDISRHGFDELGLRVGRSVGLVLLYDKNGLLWPASHRSLVTREDERRRIKGKRGVVAEAIASASALIGGAPAKDPELQAFDSLQPCKSMICVPLRVGFETYGAVLFATVRPRAYTPEHMELLTLFCNQATIALQNASLYQSLREERDKIVGKEEEARRKLARELHDGPTQDVAAIAMRLNFSRLLIERDPERARAELARLEDLAHRTVKEIRSMLFALRPVILETEGLVAALNQYAENLRDSEDLPVQIEPGNYDECLDLEVQGVVFAILEEAINNARKHAQASFILVKLRIEGDLFVAEVIDDGRGFDVEAVETGYGSRGSLGMLNLKERAVLVGGTVNVESVQGQGTRVTLLVPVDEDLD
jgi:signal transduction histidine kinase